LKKLDWGWLGGFFDGEGTISIKRVHYKGKRDLFELSISIGQAKKHAGILYLLRRRFGGRIHERQQTPRNAVAAQWSINSLKAAKFLESLYPYLKIKKPRADVALSYRKLVSRSHPGGGGYARGNVMPQYIWRKMDRLYWKLKKLNQKGPPR